MKSSLDRYDCSFSIEMSKTLRVDERRSKGVEKKIEECLTVNGRLLKKVPREILMEKKGGSRVKISDLCPLGNISGDL